MNDFLTQCKGILEDALNDIEKLPLPEAQRLPDGCSTEPPLFTTLDLIPRSFRQEEKSFDPNKHPRYPKGSTEGGKFARKETPQHSFIRLACEEAIANSVCHAEQSELHRKALHAVLRRLTTVAAERIFDNVASFEYHPSPEAITEHMVRKFPEEEVLQEVKAKGKQIAGCYTPRDLGIYLDGAFGKGREEGVLAHELFHAVDGPDRQISDSVEWQAIWEEEIAHPRPDSGKFAMTAYAAESACEGFAEAGRCLFTDPGYRALVLRRCPKVAAFFQEHGLLEKS